MPKEVPKRPMVGRSNGRVVEPYDDTYIRTLLEREGANDLNFLLLLLDEPTGQYTVAFQDQSRQVRSLAFADPRLNQMVVWYLRSRGVRIFKSLEGLLL